MNARRGFTLIETVFAIFIFSVGALGFAGTTAIVIRSLAISGKRERASRIAAARIETLRSLSCGSAQGGSELREGIQSNWTIAPSNGAISVTETVTYSVAGSPRSDTYSAILACKP